MIVKNFLFHRVSEQADFMWPPMRPQLFEKIIKKLNKQFCIVNLENFLNDVDYWKSSKKPLATVLFDDGYKDNIEYAAPILKKYSCPASFYVVTDCIDKNVPTWTYIVDFILQNSSNLKLELNAEYVPNELRRIEVDGKFSKASKRLKPWMKGLPNVRRLEVLKLLVEQSSIEIPEKLMMSWSDVSQLSSLGFTIGSHTHTHPMLGRLEAEAEIEEELSISFEILRDKLGKPPETISYPIGSFDNKVIAVSKKVGYKFGLAVEQKFYNTTNDSLYAIPRVELYQENWYKIKARMSGLYGTAKRLFK